MGRMGVHTGRCTVEEWMGSAVFVNGIYESVLDEIGKSQQEYPGEEHYLQPYASRIFVTLRDSWPTREQPVRLYASTTGDLQKVSFVADIVDWKDKTAISEPEGLELDRRIRERQPNEEGLYERGVNLLVIRNLRGLERPFSVTELILERERRPLSGRRTRSGGIAYVLPHESDIGQVTEEDMSAAEKSIDERVEFDVGSIEDARRRVAISIVQRRGQSSFRDKLLLVYRRMCTITGYDAVDALEACHISPYMGHSSNHVQNGLLLRSDIHTLFDLGLIGIDPESNKVVVSPRLRNTSYGALHGNMANLPDELHLRPNKIVLAERLRCLRQD